MSASLILINGRIYTQNDHKPLVPAVAIRDGRIIAFGSDDEIEPLSANRGQAIDLGGRSVTPGLVDAHVHFEGYALAIERVDLSDASTLDEALRIISEAPDSGEEGQWLLGRGWNQAHFPQERFPTAAALDGIVVHRPALLMHRSGHAAWANSRALKMAGIGSGTADPSGGEIQRDKSGRPTGIFFEEAIRLLSRIIPKPGQAEIQRAMREAQKNAFAWD